MCMGIPMQVISMKGDYTALCQGMQQQRNIDMGLVGVQAKGAWVVTFLGVAREVVDEQEAVQITNALQALDLVMQGDNENVDPLFADLIEREPQLPLHLQAKVDKE